MTLSTTNSSHPKSTLKAAKVQSILKLTSRQTKVHSNFQIKSSTGSTFPKVALSTPKSSQVITSNSILIMESLKDGTKSGIFMLPSTLPRLFQTLAFAWELTTKANTVIPTIVLKLISKMIATILHGTTAQLSLKISSLSEIC